MTSHQNEIEKAWKDGFLAGKNSVPKPIERHLKRAEVEKITGLSTSTIYAMMSSGNFPRPVRMGARLVAWPESRIARWLESRPDASASEIEDSQ